MYLLFINLVGLVPPVAATQLPAAQYPNQYQQGQYRY